MSLISGLLYAPFNSDTCAYRLPRILHWLGQGQWHWIHTAEARMNVAGCGYEWLATPIILFTRTDRFLFLINWVCYLMLPGLIFFVLKQLDVRPRVAWWWAWLLASGWCFVTQAASVSNDGFAAVYSLAAVALAIRSLRQGNMTDLWLSLLAAALLTGIKQTGIPLVALWMVAAAPQWRNALRKPLSLLVVIPFALLVSTVPTVLLNLEHTGTWSGFVAIKAENPDWRIELDSPFWGIVGNAFCLPVQNLVPPFFPFSHAWNHAMDVFLTTGFGAHFRSFEHFGGLSPGISESSAGIGLGIVLLALVSIFSARRLGQGVPANVSNLQRTLLIWLPWLLLLVFMAKVGERQNARHLSPYYVFFFPSLLSSAGHQILVRKLWWQKMAVLYMVLTAGLLVINTNRPLFPACTLLGKLADAHPQSRAISLLQKSYNAPRSLENLKQQLKTVLPADELVVGYAAIGNAETEPALWLPLGSRRVERVLQQDTPGQLAERGIHFVVIHNYPSLYCKNIEDWMARYHATLVANLSLQMETSENYQSHVYVMHLENP